MIHSFTFPSRALLHDFPVLTPESALLVAIAEGEDETAILQQLAKAQPAHVTFAGENAEILHDAFQALLPAPPIEAPGRSSRSRTRSSSTGPLATGLAWRFLDDPDEVAWEYYYLFHSTESRSGDGYLLQFGSVEGMGALQQAVKRLALGHSGPIL